MNRQIGFRYQEASRFALEERLQLLEARVAALTEAVQTLSRGLADGPLAEPGGRATADAARQAHDLLLAAQHPAAQAVTAPVAGQPVAGQPGEPAAGGADDG
jgi:uncharacterized membrane protein